VEGATEKKYFKIVLEDAIVTQIKAWMPNFQDTSQAHLQQMEDVSFRYTKIIWENLATSTSAEDDWRA
jgi:type VI secretion system secreted protein Hcp